MSLPLAQLRPTNSPSTEPAPRRNFAWLLRRSRRLRRWAWLLLPLAYAVVFSFLSLRQHATFHTYALDLGQFDQAIWNTAHGRFMVNTLKPPNTMGWHFSPGFVFLVPLYWLWSDIRLLFVLQSVALAASGVPLFLYLRRRVGIWPAVACLAAYYLGPSLHRVNLEEFRRLTLAVPALALAWYGLVERRPWLMTLALAWAILFEEDIALIVCCFGLYTLLARRGQWRWGLGLLLGGIAWLGLAMFVFLPFFRGQGSLTESQYPQLNYFGSLEGKTNLEALGIILSQPWAFIQPMLSLDRLGAVARELGVIGFLPLLAPDITALILPSLLLMLASTSPQLYLLQRWYMASLLPILYGAAAVALARLPQRWHPWGAGWLLLASVVGYLLFSPAPGGRMFDAEHFRLLPRHSLGASVVAQVPADAALSAQTGLVPHLAHRQEVWDFPIGVEQAEYVALDLQGSTYPLEREPYVADVKKLYADPQWSLVADCGGYLLFQRRAAESAQTTNLRWPGVAELAGYELAVENVAADAAESCFVPVEGSPVQLGAGKRLRLTLYWRALGATPQDLTVFTQLVREDGVLVGQHDSLPADVGLWPDVWVTIEAQHTSAWQPGQIVRDVHYISLAPEATGQGDVLIGWYDGQSSTRQSTAEGADHAVLAHFAIQP